MTGLLISEVFGPTVQGEGPSAGRRCAFVRLGLCNLNCSWCDTPYTWDWTRYDRSAELDRRTTETVLAQVAALGVDRVVVTGGEPLVQRAALASLVSALSDAGMVVEVETNGTLTPDDALLGAVNAWNVSPKLAHSGVDRERAWVPEVLSTLRDTGRAAFKFVCQGESDLDEVAELCALAQLPASTVWIMPEGVEAVALTDRLGVLVDAAVRRGYNVTDRLHVQVWGAARGH